MQYWSQLNFINTIHEATVILPSTRRYSISFYLDACCSLIKIKLNCFIIYSKKELRDFLWQRTCKTMNLNVYRLSRTHIVPCCRRFPRTPLILTFDSLFHFLHHTCPPSLWYRKSKYSKLIWKLLHQERHTRLFYNYLKCGNQNQKYFIIHVK